MCNNFFFTIHYQQAANLQFDVFLSSLQACNNHKEEKIIGKKAKLLFHMASKTRARKRAPPATSWCPASHYSQLHLSTAHADAILDHVRYGVGAARWGGKNNPCSCSHAMKKNSSMKNSFDFLTNKSHTQYFKAECQRNLENSLQTCKSFFKKGL